MFSDENGVYGSMKKEWGLRSWCSNIVEPHVLGLCSVECCFSYTTKIGGDDKRQSLTEKHIQQLVRISQQAPPFPSSGFLTWPFTVSAKTPEEATLNSFINDTFEKWLQAPRRLFTQK